MSRIVFAIIALLAMQGSAIESSLAEEPFRPTISVTGTSEIRVAPDEVVLTVSVESREEEVEEAFKDNDSRIRDVISLLKESGIESSYIRTEVIQVSPIFPRQGGGRQKLQQQLNQQASEDLFGEESDNQLSQLLIPTPVGYLAKRQLSVTIKQLAKFEEIYRELIQKGVNSVEGISFQTSKLREYRDQARLQAVQAAREKAMAMAKELEAQVAAIDTVTEESERYYSHSQNVLSREAPFAGESSDSIAAGMMNITASVRVVFLLDKVGFDQ